MTRKHYITIAAILASELSIATSDEEREKVRSVALSLANYFKLDNGSFDRERFLSAVGIS